MPRAYRTAEALPREAIGRPAGEWRALAVASARAGGARLELHFRRARAFCTWRRALPVAVAVRAAGELYLARDR